MFDKNQKKEKLDVVIGIPSYNEVRNISFVTKQADKGLEQFFPLAQAIIINVDNNSSDGTKDKFLKTETKNQKIYLSTKKGIKGKGYNFYNLFSLAKKYNARAVITIDADLRSIQPDWIKKMAEPIFDDYDYVAPFYSRFENDATITNQFVYPLFYGLLLLDLRQPIGGDFAFSNKLLNFWLSQQWPSFAYEYGIDSFMTLSAFFANFKIAQTNLRAKIHNPSAPKLGPMFKQVAGTIFEMILRNREKIKNQSIGRQKPKELTIFGGRETEKLKDIRPDWQEIERLIFTLPKPSKENIRRIMFQETARKIEELLDKRDFSLNSELWAKVVYDCLFSFLNNREDQGSIFSLLEYFYFWRVASSFKETEAFTPAETEKSVLDQAGVFLSKRDYFFGRY